MKNPRTGLIQECQLNYLESCIAPIEFIKLICMVEVLSVDCNEFMQGCEKDLDDNVAELKLVCEQLNLDHSLVLEMYSDIRKNKPCMLDLAQLFDDDVLHNEHYSFWQDDGLVSFVFSNFSDLYAIHKKIHHLNPESGSYLTIGDKLPIKILNNRTIATRIIKEQLDSDRSKYTNKTKLPNNPQVADLYNAIKKYINSKLWYFNCARKHLNTDIKHINQRGNSYIRNTDKMIVQRLKINNNYNAILQIRREILDKESFKQFLTEYFNSRGKILSATLIYIIENMLELHMANFNLADYSIKTNQWVIALFPEYIKSNKNILTHLITDNPHLVDYLPLDLVQIYDKSEIKQLLMLNGLLLQYLPWSYRNDETFISIALQQNSLSFEFADDAFKDNDNFALQAIKSNPANYECISDRLKQSYELAYEAVNENGMALQLLSDTWRNDPEIRAKAIKQNKLATLIL